MNASHRPKKRFRFEAFWLNLEGFDEAVTEGWRLLLGDGARKLAGGV
jgi:hypothetical protein